MLTCQSVQQWPIHQLLHVMRGLAVVLDLPHEIKQQFAAGVYQAVHEPEDLDRLVPPPAAWKNSYSLRKLDSCVTTARRFLLENQVIT